MHPFVKSSLFFLAGMILSWPGVYADAEPADWEADVAYQDEVRARNLERVRQMDEENRERHGDDTDMLVLPGLLADRTGQWVRVQAEATGLAGVEPIEFWLIAETSGHDYEAIAVSFALPSHVHKALEFIGMEAGHPVDVGARLFWPRGERVIMTFRWEDDEKGERVFRAEDLILDQETQEAMPPTGLVFVGSQWRKDPITGASVYAAETPTSPQSIASDYNESTTVLDVPRQAAQTDVYRRYIPYPERQPVFGQRLEITLKPEFPDEHKRLIDLVLHVDPETDAIAEDMDALRYRLKDEHGERVHEGDRLHHVLAAFEQLVTDSRDPFVTVVPDPNMTVGLVQTLYVLMHGLEGEDGIRLSPQPEEHLFYKAFMPDERFRVRARRPSQPLELHLVRDEEGQVTGTLIRLDRVDDDNDRHPPLKPTEYPVETSEALRERIEKIAHRIPVLLVFAPEDLAYGHLLDFIDPVREHHPTVYIYLPE